MVRKPVLMLVLMLALAAMACSLFTGSEEAPATAPDSGDQVSGERTFRELGCSGCHDGVVGDIAPSLQGVFGKEVQLESGERVVADEAYVRESILSPGARIVAGYQPVMPDFGSQISDRELDALVEYIRSLGD